MRKFAAIAVLVALSGTTQAADLGKPHATLDQIMALEAARNRTTCHVEASAAGTFLRDDRQAQFGAGVGCDAILANLLIGGGIRADFSDWRNTGSVFAKLGIVLNSGVHLYGWGEWKVPEWKVKDAGQLMLGAGTEIKLEIVNPSLWFFGEAGVAATKFGPAVGKDDVSVRTGIRYRF